MKCLECKAVFDDPSFTILGQSMCPNCGAILDIIDSNDLFDGFVEGDIEYE